MKPFLLVVAPYYKEITDQLVAGATAALAKAGRTAELLEVPGAFEIPGAIALASASERYDGFVALGCVIRGETTHYDYVCGECARGVQDLVLQDALAVGFGVLTTENMEQAQMRADVKQGDKGAEAANAALRLLEIRQMFGV